MHFCAFVRFIVAADEGGKIAGAGHYGWPVPKGCKTMNARKSPSGRVACLPNAFSGPEPQRVGLCRQLGKCPLARQAMSFFQNCITNKAACPCFYADALVFHCISVLLCKKLVNNNVLIITKLFQNMGRYPSR